MRKMAVWRRARRRRCRQTASVLLALMLAVLPASRAADHAGGPPREPVRVRRPKRTEPERLPLTQAERLRLDATVDKALEYLAEHQNADGSFQTMLLARPAVTSLCVMAFISRGYHPGTGRYHQEMERAIDYVLEFQDQETGAIAAPIGSGPRGLWSRSVNYTHGIASTMLADCYPLTGHVRFERGQAESDAAKWDLQRHERIEKAVRLALTHTRSEQTRPKAGLGEQGGWRYIVPMTSNDSDLSVTAWQMMFLHSAQQSGFRVPELWVKGGLRFVHHAYSKKLHGFVYVLSEERRYCTRATVGGGILCLLLSGETVTQPVKDAANWIANHPLEPYNSSWEPGDRYHYSAFYCSQAMSLMGGEYFQGFYPNLLRVLAENQHKDGSWDAESFRVDTAYGEVYTTALAVLALSPPYQMLKTYQR